MPTPTQLFARLWHEKYAPRAAAERAVEETRRAEAFVDGPRPVGPWLLRPLTAYDVLLCEGYECPLVAGEAAALHATPDQLWWFAWLLQTEHPHDDARARDRFIAAMRERHLPRVPAPFWRRAWAPRVDKPAPAFFADLAAALEFVERAFADSAAPQKIDPKTGQPIPGRESGTSWLAGLVIALACETGWTEQHILHLPLGRLWQYLRILDLRRGGTALAAGALAKLRSECLGEVNALLRERATATPSAS